MQRAMDGMDTPGMTKGSAPPSPQRQSPGKPGKLLIRQQSTSDSGLKSPGLSSPGPRSPASPKIDPKTGRPIQPRGSPQPSPAKAKQESSFFGGFGGISLGGLTDSVKPPASAAQATESVTGKLFGGFGGLVESAKPQAPAKQESAKPPTTSRSQMFGFGSSILSSATNLVTGSEGSKAADQPAGSLTESSVDSELGSPPESPFSAPGSPPDSDSAPDTPPATSKRAHSPFTEVGGEDTPVEPEAQEAIAAPPASPSVAPTQVPVAREHCPLCKAEMNVGSSEPPDYSHCSECKKTVCNLCGFNTPSQQGEVRNT